MKRIVLLTLAVIMFTGCSVSVTKKFKVLADPPDATVTVIAGPDMKIRKYRSPATITAQQPGDPALAARAVLQVSKETYLTRTIALRDIADGQTLNIRLEKSASAIRYRPVYQMLAPAASDTLQFRDRDIAVSFSITDLAVQMRFENHTAEPVKILWDRAQYIDEREQPHRLMHSGVRFQDRNNPIADQTVQPRGVLQEGIYPVRNVVVTGGKPPYTLKRLLPLDTDSAEELKGKTLSLFLPVEINRAIVAYTFKILVSDIIKEEPAK